MDAASAAELINERTRAILPIHLYGCPSDMDAIAGLAATHDLTVIEDAAQAIGASIDGRMVGSWDIGCFSLYATKNVTTAEGGMLTTDDAATADRLRLLRNQGMRTRYEFEVRGYNLRLTDLQAAVGIPQMQRLDELTKRRRENAAALSSGLAGIPGLRTPPEREGRHHVFHQYTIDLAPGTIGREALADHLAKRRIGSGVYYPKLAHDHRAFRGDDRVAADPTPGAAGAVKRILSLPVHPAVGDPEIDRTVAAVREALD